LFIKGRMRVISAPFSCQSRSLEKSLHRCKRLRLWGVRVNVIGEPEWIRTTDPKIRNFVLYPTELRVHFFEINPSMENEQLNQF
jgi:hypothetical protein